MLGLVYRAFGRTLVGRLGSLCMLLGLGLLAYSAGAYFGLFPGGYTVLPDPVALTGGAQRAARLEPTALPAPDAPLQLFEVVAADAVLSPRDPPLPPPATSRTEFTPAVGLKLEAADAADRRAAALAGRPGVPVELVIPSINVDTEVKPAGLIENKDGQLEWETLPFVAANYAMLGPVGAPGNAVVAGHVVTLSMGNVFRNLYQVELGQPIEAYTADSHFTYVVSEIKLVPPDAVEVLEPTEDARLTVITCGGTFDPRTRTFSDRLIVVGKLAKSERL